MQVVVFAVTIVSLGGLHACIPLVEVVTSFSAEVVCSRVYYDLALPIGEVLGLRAEELTRC